VYFFGRCNNLIVKTPEVSTQRVILVNKYFLLLFLILRKFRVALVAQKPEFLATWEAEIRRITEKS
jgi:hypothetical protein